MLDLVTGTNVAVVVIIIIITSLIVGTGPSDCMSLGQDRPWESGGGRGGSCICRFLSPCPITLLPLRYSML